MARRAEFCGIRHIEADNGIGWHADSRSSVLAVAPNKHVAVVFGIEYWLEKFKDPDGVSGWYLYSSVSAVQGGFHAVHCAPTLMPAIDEASKLIAEADLRGEGYEKEEA